MQQRWFSRWSTRYSLGRGLLLALALRALIPVGYMPATDGRLGLQICPDAFPAQLFEAVQPTDHHLVDASHPGPHPNPADDDSHPHGLSATQHCLFAAILGSSAAPLDTQLVVNSAESSLLAPADPQRRVPADEQLRVQQPRAPPHLIENALAG